MVNIVSKGQLEVFLSRLEGFLRPKVRLEQYVMDGKIGAEILWNAFMKGDIEDKVIGDLGCGTGILGIGALLLGAKRVLFIDIDEEALLIAKNNLAKAKSEDNKLGETIFLCQDVKDFNNKVDTVLQNPPFGVQKRGSDRIFLEKAIEHSNVVYHFGKAEGNDFIQRVAKAKSVKVSDNWLFDYPIKATHSFHSKKIHRFRASCWRIEKDL